MKKVEIVPSHEVEIETLELHAFSQGSKEKFHRDRVSKKVLRELADRLGLESDSEKIVFAKKLINAYLAER